MTGKNIVCFRHPKYLGDDDPDLSCKACCAAFVERLKAKTASERTDISSWLDSKSSKEIVTWSI